MAEKIVCKYCGEKFDSETALGQHKKDKHQKELKPLKISKKTVKNSLIYSVVILVVIGLSYGIFYLATSKSRIGPIGSTHIHQDIKMYVNGQQIYFSQQKYQLRSKYVHFENLDGDIIHTHATGVTIGDLLSTLEISFDKNCLKLDTREKFCNNGDKTLKFYVNGRPNDQWGNYEFHDLDKILISFGNENEDKIQAQLNSITNLACEESGKPCGL